MGSPRAATAFFEETQAAYVCSTETCGAVEDGVEDGLQVVRRARNGAQHLRDGRLLLDDFGQPILQLRSGPFFVDTLVHTEQFLGLDGEGSITAPAAVRDSSHGRPNRRCCQTSNVRCGCQKAKYSRRTDVFRFTPKTGHRSMQSACPKRTKKRHFKTQNNIEPLRRR